MKIYNANRGFDTFQRKRRKRPNVPKAKPSGRMTGIVVLAVILIFAALQSFYNVNEQEQAVVTRFGKVTDVKTAGLYFKLPFIDRVSRVDTTTHGMQIGYTNNTGAFNTYSDGSDAGSSEREAVMITSDFNFVDIDFYLEYRVTDPVKYLYNSTAPDSILRNLAQEAIRTAVSNYTVDEVITTGKSQIQSKVREKIVNSLQNVQIGMEIVNISIQDAEPPTSRVMEAFKAVETAKQGADTAVNNAKQYRNEQIPAAEAEADKIVQEAEARKQARIAEAEGQAERFNDIYEEYRTNPEVTKKRLFYETMEDILPELKVIITDGNTQSVLPLGSFADAEENSGAAGTAGGTSGSSSRTGSKEQK